MNFIIINSPATDKAQTVMAAVAGDVDATSPSPATAGFGVDFTMRGATQGE